MSKGEEQVHDWLKLAGIPFMEQYRFHPIRRWRFDFVLGYQYAPSATDVALTIPWVQIAIEVEGGQFTGGHKRGAKADTDLEKFNAATLAGWKVLRYSTGMVERGEAWDQIHVAWADAKHEPLAQR